MKIFLLIVFLSIALLSNDVATITGFNGKAFVERDAKEIELKLGDKLQEKDIVKTKDKTKVQIIFKDETIVTIGNNSTFAISEYLFEENKEPVAKFGMLNGAMRAITGRIGKVAPDKFMVKTKTATMGIRGTNFTLLVGEDGSYQAYCTHGAIGVNVGGTNYIVQQGFFLSISPNGEVELKEFSPEDLKEMKKKNFAKSKSKKAKASEDKDADSDGQLDNTRDEKYYVDIYNIENDTKDANQQNADLSSLISSYSMSDAQYTGSYSTTRDSGGDWGNGGAGGTATLNVDFGNDDASLVMNDGNSDFTVNGTTTISGTSLSIEDHTGVKAVDATFQGPTGNSATGTFSMDVGGSGNEEGTFDVSTQQVLH